MSEVLEIREVAPRAVVGARVLAFVELAKPRIVGLVLIITSVGFYLSLPQPGGTAQLLLLLHALLGTALVGAGANALNQYLEVEFDRRMTRTQDRPLPSGRVTCGEALTFGVVSAASGVAYLNIQVNAMSSLLAAVTLLSYVVAYTPMKRVTPLSVYIGAVPGALPPLIGWAAASGTVARSAWVLFVIVFLWQLPHFAAIAWQYREDYAQAGFPILAAADGDRWRTNLHVVTHTVALIAVSLLPAPAGLCGALYAVGAMALGVAFLASGVLFLCWKTTELARVHVLASVTYLPLLFGLMMVDAAPR